MTQGQAVESLIAFARNTKARVLDYEHTGATIEVASCLNLPVGEPVIRAMRIRPLDGEPLGLIESYVLLSAGSALSRTRLAKTPVLELLRSSGHTIGGGRQAISSVTAGRELAAKLHFEPLAPIVRIERMTQAITGIILAYTIAQYRGDRYRLTLDLRSTPKPIAGRIIFRRP